MGKLVSGGEAQALYGRLAFTGVENHQRQATVCPCAEAVDVGRKFVLHDSDSLALQQAEHTCDGVIAAMSESAQEVGSLDGILK